MNDLVFEFFKTFVDLNRLRIAALLSQESLPVEAVARRVNLRPRDLPRHLAQLNKMGLLLEENGSYRLDIKALERLSQDAMAGQHPEAAARSNDPDASDFDRKVVKNYSYPDGRLKELPLQQKKLLAVLRHVVQSFEPGSRYSEKQVNETLTQYHEDFASLRRALIDHQLIKRETGGQVYWRE